MQDLGIDNKRVDPQMHVSTSSMEGVKPESINPQLELRGDPDSQEDQWVTGIKLLNIIAAVALVCLLMLLDTSIISTVCCLGLSRQTPGPSPNSCSQAIPRITSEFHSLADVGWYGSAYQLARYVFKCYRAPLVTITFPSIVTYVSFQCCGSTTHRQNLYEP